MYAQPATTYRGYAPLAQNPPIYDQNPQLSRQTQAPEPKYEVNSNPMDGLKIACEGVLEPRSEYSSWASAAFRVAIVLYIIVMLLMYFMSSGRNTGLGLQVPRAIAPGEEGDGDLVEYTDSSGRPLTRESVTGDIRYVDE